MIRILIIAGEGGHLEQAERLRTLVFAGQNDIEIHFLSDAKKAKSVWTNVTVVPPARCKHTLALFTMISSGLMSVIAALRLLLIINCRVCISLGPGISIIPSALFRLFGRRIIHIETWSRFESKSMTGVFMEKIATDFLIQNEELKVIYPKATFSGRL